MIKRKDILRLITPVAAGAIIIFAIGFVENKQLDKSCQEIVIDVDSQYDNYFVDKEEVMFLVTQGGSRNIIGSWWRDIDLKAIERELLTHKFVKKADVYKDLEGRLLVDVYQQRPIARLTPKDSPHAYISSEGEILPISDSFTSRVMLIGGDFAGKLTQSDLSEHAYGLRVLELIKYVDESPFWRAQVAGIEIAQDGNIRLFPQVTKQLVAFGKPENIPEKFKKLEIFYTEILPGKGWNHYSQVNLKYQNQIICE